MPLATDRSAGPDLARMRAERRARLQREMERRGIGALLLLGTSGLGYAVGDCSPVADASHRLVRGTAALLMAGEPLPHLFTSDADRCPEELRADHCHAPLHPWTPEGVRQVAEAVQEMAGGALGGSLAVDEMTAALHAGLGGLLPRVETIDGAEALSAAKVVKTADEIACIEEAQRVNEDAADDVEAMLRPGVRQSELTGRFLRHCLELGATGNCVDPIWQVMAPSLAEGPFSATGGVAFPLVSTDRILLDGDVVWVDTGIDYHGYVSDFGTTWIIGSDPVPSDRQRAQFERWKEVVAAVLAEIRPGATGHQLASAATAANDGVRPWLDHLYLAHGIGTFSAEMPLIGTDLGPDFDESILLEPGMVLVLEPVVWDEGAGGYRYEVVVVVTEDGHRRIGSYPHRPFGDGSG